MTNPVHTAVIAAAGQGTRMWPSTKVVSKELFPLGRIPVIVHVLWELAEAGIERVIIVAARHNREDISRLLDAATAPPIKFMDDPLVYRFQQMLATTSISILEQTADYGNGIPLTLAAELVGGEPCIYAFGDDVVIGENVTRGLIETFHRTGACVLAAQEVAAERRAAFGIVECEQHHDVEYISRFFEKPTPHQTESNLASFGRYLVTPSFVELLRGVERGRDGEIWFTDAVHRLLHDGGIACPFRLTVGKWYTVGDPTGYADAVRAATQEQLDFVSQRNPSRHMVEAV